MLMKYVIFLRISKMPKLTEEIKNFERLIIMKGIRNNPKPP